MELRTNVSAIAFDLARDLAKRSIKGVAYMIPTTDGHRIMTYEAYVALEERPYPHTIVFDYGATIDLTNLGG